MRKFAITVNGQSYEVEVEEIDSAAAGETASAPKKAAPKAAQLNGSEKTITAPMPGSILAVNVKPGDSFRSGQVATGMETDFSLEISSEELREGDRVITDPTGLSDGLPVSAAPVTAG